jgi:hypothetical protein
VIRQFAWVSKLGRLTRVTEPYDQRRKTIVEEFPVLGYRLKHRAINAGYAGGGGEITIVLDVEGHSLALSASGSEMRRLAQDLIDEADELGA